jgi:transposase
VVAVPNELLFSELEEVPVGIVGGLDIHRRQITFDYLDTDTSEVRRGKIARADRQSIRAWLTRFDGRRDVAFAMEGCTGWRFIVEELERASIEAHVAEPADTAKERGRKKRAKTDRADARLQRELLATGRLPGSWIPPDHVLEVRTKVRLYCALADERKGWMQRIHATLFHQGAPAVAGRLFDLDGQAQLATAQLSAAGRQLVEVALRQIGHLDRELHRLRAELIAIARRQPGCRAIQAHYGVGGLLSVAIWEELGDCRRFSSSSDAVRHSGLDVTVWSSDAKRSKGHLARQGPSVLRWALYEAGMSAAKRTSPDHDYFCATKARLGTSRAALSVGRKIARRCYHSLRELGDDAMATIS